MDLGGIKVRFKLLYYIVFIYINVIIVYILCVYFFISSLFIYIRCFRKVVMLLELF